MKGSMAKNKITEVVGNVKIIEIPHEVSVPVYKKEEKPEYVLVKEEVVYKVPKIQYENHTYEKPILKEREYEIPVYKERVYEIPIYKEVEYERPKYVEKKYDIPRVTIHDQEEVNVKVIEKPYEIEVPKLIEVDKVVTNAIVEDRHVTNAIIKHVTIEALHPRYLCSKCKKEPADES